MVHRIAHSVWCTGLHIQCGAQHCFFSVVHSTAGSVCDAQRCTFVRQVKLPANCRAGARDVQRTDGFTDIAFHKGQSEMSRPHAVAIAAGAAHSCCLTRTGVVLAWRSWDPNLSVHEVSASLAGKQVVSIAAGMSAAGIICWTEGGNPVTGHRACKRW